MGSEWNARASVGSAVDSAVESMKSMKSALATAMGANCENLVLPFPDGKGRVLDFRAVSGFVLGNGGRGAYGPVRRRISRPTSS